MLSIGAQVESHRSGQTLVLFPVLTRDLKPLTKTNLAANIFPCKKKKKKKKKKFKNQKAQNFSIWIRLSSKGIYIFQKNGLRSFSLHRIGLKVKILKFSLHGMGLKAQNCPLHGMSSKPENLFLNVMDLRAKVFTSWNGLKSPKLPATSNELKARKFIP